MKPDNWDNLSNKEKKTIAMELAPNVRGQYIFAQALVKAINSMNQVPIKQREVSNIEDMEILLELFPVFREVVHA